MAMKMCLMVALAVAMFGAALARPGYDHDYDVSLKCPSSTELEDGWSERYPLLVPLWKCF